MYGISVHDAGLPAGGLLLLCLLRGLVELPHHPVRQRAVAQLETIGLGFQHECLINDPQVEATGPS